MQENIVYNDSYLNDDWITTFRRDQIAKDGNQNAIIVPPAVCGYDELRILLKALLHKKQGNSSFPRHEDFPKDSQAVDTRSYLRTRDRLKQAQFMQDDTTFTHFMPQPKPTIEVLYNTGGQHYVTLYFSEDGVAYQNSLGTACPEDVKSLAKTFYQKFYDVNDPKKINERCHFYEGIQQQQRGGLNTCGEWFLFNANHFATRGVGTKPPVKGTLTSRDKIVEVVNTHIDLTPTVIGEDTGTVANYNLVRLKESQHGSAKSTTKPEEKKTTSIKTTKPTPRAEQKQVTHQTKPRPETIKRTPINSSSKNKTEMKPASKKTHSSTPGGITPGEAGLYYGLRSKNSLETRVKADSALKINRELNDLLSKKIPTKEDQAKITKLLEGNAASNYHEPKKK